MKRKIPVTMVTQHPDNATKPYWHYKTYISTQYEAEEAYRSFSDIGATEYKWDWEGKLVDESLLERFYGDHFNYFSNNILGRDIFLTFRLPNPRVETEFRLGRAFINMASGASVAKHFGFSIPPLFEVILPLTETAEEMLALQEAFQEIHYLKHPLYKLNGFLTNLYVIPLFENVSTIMNADKILQRYIMLFEKTFKKRNPYLRPYLARSDPALNSGLISTVLAIKISLSRLIKLSQKEHMPFYPILGSGSLPFRGGLTPTRVKDFVQEYKGIRTVTIQSAFRYDYPLNQVQSAVAYLEENLPRQDAESINKTDEKRLLFLIQESEKLYKHTIEHAAPLINLVAAFIPERRERFLHVGLFGYSRGVGKIKLPRAISFTCALYSIGIPPEFIGTGKTISFAKRHKLLPLLEKYFVNIKKDLLLAGRYLNKKNLKKLATASPVWQGIQENVEEIETYLDEKLEPVTAEEKKHEELTGNILRALDSNTTRVAQYIKQAGVLRKSLG